MKEYICIKCNKKFKQKSNYTDHINRKTPCTDESTINIESLITKIDKMEKGLGVNINILGELREVQKVIVGKIDSILRYLFHLLLLPFFGILI